MLIDSCNLDLICLATLFNFQEIKVLPICLACHDTLGLPLMCAAFEIKLELKHVFILELYCVLHQAEIDWRHSFSVDSEHPENLGNQRIRIVLHMLDKIVKNSKHQLDLIITDCFDHELFVMSEKEETAALARALACLEDLIVIFERVETHFQHLECQIVQFEKFSEFIEPVVRDFCFKGTLNSFNFIKIAICVK